MAISVKYHLIKRKDGIEKKLPYISIELNGEESNLWVETRALIDSGADISVIPKDFAELIGVKIDGEPGFANGIGGQVRVITSKMNLKIKGDHTTYQFNIPVQVVLDESKIPVLLGRDGFFSYFRIEFDHYKERVKLIRNNVKDFRVKDNNN